MPDDAASNEPPVPRGVENTGQWEMRDFGTVRRIEWQALYDNPLPAADGTVSDNVVRATALQDTNGRIAYFGVAIDVRGDFALGEARLIAATIRDIADRIQAEFGQDE